MTYYSLCEFCLFGPIMRANHKWGTVTEMYSKSFIRSCKPAGKAYLAWAPLSFFLLFLPHQMAKFWLGSRSSWTHCFLQLALQLVGLILLRNQRHRWDQYQDQPALPVWIQCSRKFTNSPSTPLHSAPLHSYNITERWKILECQWLFCFSPWARSHSQTVYHLSAVSVRPINLKLKQSSSAQESKFSSLCACVSACVHSDSLQRIVKRRSCQEAVSKYICRQICFCMTCVFCPSICALWRSYNSASDNDHVEEVIFLEDIDRCMGS